MHDNRRQPCKTRDFHYRSIHDRDAFWREQAGRVHWETPFESVLDFSRPPFAKWFVGGKTNLCYNAVDRWLPTQAEDPALIWVSTEVDRERIYTRQDVYEEVNAAAAMLKELGVERGDRVLLYMPMVPEAVFTMLACARIGAVHSVVFGGFASVNLAQRIDDAAPKVIVCTDGGSRAGKVVPYKPLLDRALGLCKTRRPPWWCSTEGWRPSSRWRGATWTTPRCAPGIRARGCRWPGWSRPNPAISCTRQARPASPRACSATPAAMPWRWLLPWSTCSTASRATRTSAPATSAGWWGTRTSSMAR